MNESKRYDFDAVVIGAGVIGAVVGYELGRRGLRTLNVDKWPAAGYGSPAIPAPSSASASTAEGAHS